MAGRPKLFVRDEVLGRALDLFWRRGYEATGLRALLAHMGIGRQSLYDTFGTKQDLFLEALQRYDAFTLDQTRAALAGSGSPLQKVRSLVCLWGERTIDPAFYGCFINNTAVERSLTDPDAARIVRTHYQKLTRLLEEALHRAKEAEELKPEADPRTLAHFLVALVQGLLVLGKAKVPEEAIRDATATVLSVLDTAAA